MNIQKLILGVDSPTEEELGRLKSIQDKHLHVVLVITGCVAATAFFPILVFYLGMSLFAGQILSAPLSPFQFILIKVVFVSWIVVGSILGFYFGSRVLGRGRPGYSIRQAARDYFKAPIPKQIIEDYRNNKKIEPDR